MEIKVEEIAESVTVTPTGNNVLSLEEILGSIAAFKKVTPLSRKTTPTYSDEDATIYLTLTTSKTNSQEGFVGNAFLPHLLSMNRSICLFEKDYDTLEAKSFKNKLIELGATDIKVVTGSEMMTAIANNVGSLEEIARTYDTLIPALPLRVALGTALKPTLNALGKTLDFPRITDLKKCPLFLKPGLGGYSIKVGHTGFSEQQLTENVKEILRKVQNWPRWFPQGLAHFEKVTLKTGTTPGVTVYTNPGVVVPEPVKSVYVGKYLMPQKHQASTTGASKKKNKKRKIAVAVTPSEKNKEVAETPKSPKNKKRKLATGDAPWAKDESDIVEMASPAVKGNKKQKATNGVPASVTNNVVALVSKSPKSKNKKQKAAGGVPASVPNESVKVETASPAGKGKKKQKAADGVPAWVANESVTVETASPAVKGNKKQKANNGVQASVTYNTVSLVSKSPKSKNKKQKQKAANEAAIKATISPVNKENIVEAKSPGKTGVQLSAVGEKMKGRNRKQKKVALAS